LGAVVLAGAVVFIASFLPVLNPEQCPEGYTQAQIDESNCIVGSNIGAGLAWLLGIALSGAGALGLLISVVRRRSKSL
jgi:hypothetical protein